MGERPVDRIQSFEKHLLSCIYWAGFRFGCNMYEELKGMMAGITVKDGKNEVLLEVTKEIVVKFIEMGKVTPATFDETFKSVYRTVKEVSQSDKD